MHGAEARRRFGWICGSSFHDWALILFVDLALVLGQRSELDVKTNRFGELVGRCPRCLGLSDLPTRCPFEKPFLP